MLDSLKKIINPDVVIDIATGEGTLAIKEDGTDSKIKKLTITALPDKAFAFTLDHQPGGSANRIFQQLSCYVDVTNDSGVNKGCDLVVIAPDNAENYTVLVFDLKSDKPRKEATEKQLTNSELYVKYLISMVETHYGKFANEIHFKRSIVTTDLRNQRKNPIYPPNQKVDGSYKVKAVRVNQAKEGVVHFGAL